MSQYNRKINDSAVENNTGHFCWAQKRCHEAIWRVKCIQTNTNEVSWFFQLAMDIIAVQPKAPLSYLKLN